MQALNLTPDEAEEIIDTYRNDPLGIYEDWFKIKPWSAQVDILKAVFENSEVAVKSCHGTGKSFNAARIALAFLITHPGSVVITTAPTWVQVKDVIWRELGTAYEHSEVPIGGRLYKTSLDFAKDWYAVGRSTSKPDNFVGYHADHILVIADEAAGIEEPIFEGIRGVTSNQNAHTLYIGNPTSLAGSFYEAFRNPLVKTFTISCWQTPNFTENNINSLDDLLEIFTPKNGEDHLTYINKVSRTLKEPYPGLIAPLWVYRRYLEWGTETPMWYSRILGEFPSQPENTLIPLSLCEAAMDENYISEHNWQIEDGELEYGIDVARYGSDKTVIAPRKGGKVFPLTQYSRQDTVTTTDKIIQSLNLDNWKALIKIDDSTMGGGVTDLLIRRKQDNPIFHYRVVPILFNNKPNNPNKFYDKRAEMYWTVRDYFYNHRISLPKDNELANQLAAIQYKITTKGLIQIEQKDEIKKRTGKSPDKADALVLAFSNSGPGVWADANVENENNQEPITSGFSQRF